MIDQVWDSMKQHTSRAGKVRLFMDYDGTLADFAPAPDVIQPDPALIEILKRLVRNQKYLPIVISGRSLQHLKELLPMKGLLLAGTYGLEIEQPDGSHSTAVELDQVRPVMAAMLPKWQALLDGQVGFHLEDKGWALAMHARFATLNDANRVLDAAQWEIEKLSPGSDYAVERRERFLEIVPAEANKRRSVGKILAQYTPAGALPIYLGDDQNDESAFESILAAKGLCVRVSKDDIETRAQYRLTGPAQVRELLVRLAAAG